MDLMKHRTILILLLILISMCKSNKIYINNGFKSRATANGIPVSATNNLISLIVNEEPNIKNSNKMINRSKNCKYFKFHDWKNGTVHVTHAWNCQPVKNSINLHLEQFQSKYQRINQTDVPFNFKRWNSFYRSQSNNKLTPGETPQSYHSYHLYKHGPKKYLLGNGIKHAMIKADIRITTEIKPVLIYKNPKVLYEPTSTNKTRFISKLNVKPKLDTIHLILKRFLPEVSEPIKTQSKTKHKYVKKFTGEYTIDKAIGIKNKMVPRHHNSKQLSVEQNLENTHAKHNITKQRSKRYVANLRIKRKSKKSRKFHPSAWMDQNAYREIFDKYYECLERKVATLNGDINNAIKPILLIVGQSVDLECDVCTRPDQSFEALGIDWQMLRRADAKMKHVEFGNKKRSRMKLMKDYSLHIKSATIMDAGQYFCVVQNNYASVYQLDILMNEKRRIIFEGNKKDKLQRNLFLPERNLNVSTVWTPWSFCDRCGAQGTQRKLGLCMVKKIDKSAPIRPVDFPMIDLYPDGIPCHSTALPKFLKRIKEIKERASETLVRNCIQPCPTTPGPITITDKAGKVIEVIEPGFYSIQHPPTIPPMTQRKVIYEDAGKHLVLSCPKRAKRVIVVWKRNTVVVNPLTIRKLTRNRVFIDKASRLHIRKLYLSDTASYLCFLQQEHVATFKVMVYEPMNQHLKDYISLIGMVLTCLSIVVICLCLCCKKNKKTNQ